MNALSRILEWPVAANDDVPLALWSAPALAEAMGGSASAHFVVSGVEIDSRDVVDGDLFFALQGEAMDGHRFIDMAVAKGAAAAVTDREVAGPHVLVDDTTAALVALGQHASAFMTKDEALQAQLITLGEESGDLVWPLPLWDEYKAPLKSHRADISNIATNFSRFGGSIEGGTFLSFFAPKNVPWAHIDIAPRMDSIASDKLAKGATGEPVRLLVQLIKQS